MIGLTVVIHAVGLDFIIRHAKFIENIVRSISLPFWKPLTGASIVICVFAVHIIQIWIWALLYYNLGAFPGINFSDVLYFSTATYTTVGYGDIVASSAYKMLSAIEGANGFLLLGWTTAFIFELISRLYRHEIRDL